MSPPLAGLVLTLAAGAEIAGCWLVHAVIRLGWPPVWLLPAGLLLGLFAALLAMVDTGAAGRTFAVYGGIYIAATLVWLRFVEGGRLAPIDLAGAGLVLAGSLLLFLGRPAA